MKSTKASVRRVLTLALVLIIGSAYLAASASAGTYDVVSCRGNAAPVFGASPPTGVGLGVSNGCVALGLLAITATPPASNGSSGPFQQAAAGWAAVTPSPSLRIIFASSNGQADCNLTADGWSASYFWGDNGTNYGTSPVTIDCHGATGSGAAGYLNQSIQSSRYLGFHASCIGSCTSAGLGGLVFGISAITLEIEEDSGPSLAPAEANDIYNQTGWVRGTFPAGFNASDPSGICAMQTQVNGAVLNSYSDPTPDTSNWSQCPGSTLPGSVDTTKYYPDGSGAISLQYAASNAAGVVGAVSRSINVDNAPVSVALTGPAEAPSTAGTQYITATATAGASGVRGINCSLDDGAAQWYAGSSTQIPVSGLGEHTLTCRGENNSYNASGLASWSAAATFQMEIGDPTLSGISFSKIVDGLRCKKMKERVKVSSRWVTIHRNHKLMRIHRRAHRKTIKVVKCRARTVKRTVVVLVKERRHGRVVLVKRKKIERVVVAPHLLNRSSERVRHGKGITVNGWLGITSGVALPGRTVDVMTAPDNGLGQWTLAAVVTTAADGAWSAALPAGPSRLVEASYGGDTATLPSASATIQLIVPAKIKIHIAPRSTPWGGTIRISGRVLGGYIPTGKLLRLRIGVAGVRGTVGIPSVRRNGRFRTTWTFSSGHGVVHYWFSVSTLNEADYPFAPAGSRRVYVRVGPG
jgi:hypothetical protein